MNKEIEKIEIVKIKRKLYMITYYNNDTKYIKKLNEKDKTSLFYALTEINILNKYRCNYEKN